MIFFPHVARQKTSNGLWSGKHGGHMNADFFELNLPENLTSDQFITFLGVWDESSSCMKMARLLTSSEDFGNISINIC